jgi:hypothetical protein
MAYITAIGLASVAALFSIKGMVTLFPGAPVLVIAMASMMETGKLVAAGWLARRRRATAWIWHLVLVTLIATPRACTLSWWWPLMWATAVPHGRRWKRRTQRSPPASR